MALRRNQCCWVLSLLSQTVGTSLYAAESVEEIRVIGITPGATATQALRKVPYAVQSTVFADLEAARTLDLSDYMNNRLGSVTINSAQNNPLQADVQFRGFTASPLLGLPQGISVYQNGVRINEPLGDAVNWDLVPESAVYSMELLSGSNPVFGLNTLGGALALTMKNGFNFVERQAELTTGSWGRLTGTIESGANNGTWAYYANYSYFDEDGWRALSASAAHNFYTTLSWRAAEATALDLTYQHSGSELIGNGPLPVGQLALQRSSVFTAPDITANDVDMVDLAGSHRFSPDLQFSGNVFWRDNITHSFNGDGSEFELCEFAGGTQALFEESDAIEDLLEDQLGIALDGICAGGDAGIRDFADLEDLIAVRALGAGLDPEAFAIENITDALSGSGALSDEAINNISRREQVSSGLSGQFTLSADLFARTNQFVAGYSWFRGESTFESVLELAALDPLTRSTQGLGTGTYFDEAATDIRTETATLSWYFTNTLDLSPQLAVTLSGRYNDTAITLRDRSGVRPELNGDHDFARFNPALGFTWSPDADLTVYGSWSEANRVPTPIELACNEGVFELAQQFALAAGEDPDAIEFECRLPNAFLADPPLDDVVTRSVEVGLRGSWRGFRYQAGVFNAVNRDDILFQTTGRATGLFANIDETQRRGVELSLSGLAMQVQWYAAYTYLQANFGDAFRVLSPNHPNADAAGELAVAVGDRMPGLPRHIFKFGGDYRVSEQLSVGAELLYNSDQVLRGDEANELESIDGYALVNLRTSYEFSRQLLVFARVTNLFDRDYENFGLLGEDPSEILPGLADTRPRFLGVGAPRAAWVGVQLRF